MDFSASAISRFQCVHAIITAGVPDWQGKDAVDLRLTFAHRTKTCPEDSTPHRVQLPMLWRTARRNKVLRTFYCRWTGQGPCHDVSPRRHQMLDQEYPLRLPTRETSSEDPNNGTNEHRTYIVLFLRGFICLISAMPGQISSASCPYCHGYSHPLVAVAFALSQSRPATELVSAHQKLCPGRTRTLELTRAPCLRPT